MPHDRTANPALRIAVTYLLIGSLWILFSDLLVYQLPDRDVRVKVHTLKGWLYVGLSAAAVYFLTRRYLVRLERAHRAIAASEERLNLALTVSRMGVWEWDLKSDRVVWSSECYEIVGLHDFDGSFESFSPLIHPADAEHVFAIVQNALEQRSEYVDEFRIIRPDSGEVRWLSNHGRASYDKDGTPLVLLGTVHDITERKRTEGLLRESEERYRAVVEDQTEVIARFRPDGTLTFVNDVYCRLFGQSRDQLLGGHWKHAVFSGEVPLIESRLQEMSPDHPIVTIENRVYSATGEMRWMQFVSRGFYDDHGKLIEIQAVGRDITDIKQAKNSLRLYAQRLIEMDEELRRNLATELHDEIGRDLTALGLSVAILQDNLPEGGHEKMSDRLEDMREMLESVSRTIRGLMSDLRPPVLDDYGLPAALRWYCDLFARRTALAVELTIANEFPRLATERELALFRITQEALNNISKHSQARTVTLMLEKIDGVVLMTVGDDGTGFDPGQINQRQLDSHWGLTIMRERAQSIGGHLEVVTATGKGTTIRVELKEET